MDRFLELLNEIVQLLQGYSTPRIPGSFAWNGSKYEKVSAPRPFDPHALAWSSSLRTTIAMLERQASPITASQMSYIERDLFGGMGSFADFSLDADVFGDSAKDANARLEKLRRQVFQALQSLKETGALGERP